MSARFFTSPFFGTVLLGGKADHVLMFFSPIERTLFWLGYGRSRLGLRIGRSLFRLG